MCGVGAYWFQDIFMGGNAPNYCDKPWGRNDEFSGDQLIAIYEEVCAVNREIERGAASLEQRSVVSVTWADGANPPLRWVMNHLIEEEARHNGHADLLRDGGRLRRRLTTPRASVRAPEGLRLSPPAAPSGR
jgi:hypothetical protein